LIDNAIKYRANQHLKVRDQAIEQEGKWLTSVSDNGLGINKDPKHRPEKNY
jgi:light-regulated signal transduction histidine kinase (bacteriophytochrome)